MILFSDRMKLAKLYEEWLKKSREQTPIQDCPQNVITFLQTIEALSEDRVKELVKDVEI